MTATHVLATGLEYPEGPAVDHNGDVYVAEIRGGRVCRWRPDQGLSIFAEPGGGPNAIAFDQQGRLYVANSGGFEWEGNRAVGRPAGCQENAGIQLIQSGEEPAHVFSGETTFNAPNDLAFDAEGNVYFTDPGFGKANGRIFFGQPYREVHCIKDEFKYCNGLAFTPSGAALAIAESYTNRVLIYEVQKPGVLVNERVLATLPEGHYPDGMAYDSSSNLLVAGAGGGTIHVFDSSGNEVEQIATEDKFVTNLAFGGLDMQTVYATESNLGRLIAFEWPHAGLPLYPQRNGERDAQ